MHSSIYAGQVSHRRFAPRQHAFAYRLFMLYLDLDELDQVFRGRWLWSTRRAAIACFRRRDHLGDPDLLLGDAVRDLVEQRTGARPTGPIRLLTHLRYFGYCFNPVSFYYCFDEAGNLKTLVAEVNNTPWRERHVYVLDAADGEAIESMRHHVHKQFHVSPFMPMDIDYEWKFNKPGKRLSVYMKSLHQGRAVFDSVLDLKRRPIRGTTLAGVLARQPAMTARVIVAIYYQALRLALKRVPFHAHPRSRAA